jgi:hypothetical protein
VPNFTSASLVRRSAQKSILVFLTLLVLIWTMIGCSQSAVVQWVALQICIRGDLSLILDLNTGLSDRIF